MIGLVGILALAVHCLVPVPVVEAQGSLPRIAVRAGRFVVAATGREFRPFGFHYIRLRSDGAHYVFAPGLYDAARADAMLADLETHGANVVRVFFGSLGIVGPNGLDTVFVNNLCDFLERATRHHVYVLPVVDWIPAASRYKSAADAGGNTAGGMQALFLNDARIGAKARYLTDVIAAIRRHDRRLLSTVLAYELENEACFEMSAPPFSVPAIPFEYAGRRYTMSDDSDVQALMDAATQRWAGRLVAAVRRADPQALVGASVFTYAAVGRTGPSALRRDSTPDVRVPMRPLTLAASRLSYVDVHLYAASPEGVQRDLKSIEWERLRDACRKRGKPLLAGEFGTFRVVHPSEAAAAYAMGWYLRSIAGLGFAGAIYWTYDCEEQAPLWNAKSASGGILKALCEAHAEIGGRP